MRNFRVCIRKTFYFNAESGKSCKEPLYLQNQGYSSSTEVSAKTQRILLKGAIISIILSAGMNMNEKKIWKNKILPEFFSTMKI